MEYIEIPYYIKISLLYWARIVFEIDTIQTMSSDGNYYAETSFEYLLISITSSTKNTKTLELTENNEFKYSIDLPVYDKDNRLIEYVVNINEKSGKRNIEINKNWVGKPGKAKFALFKKGETKQLDYSEKQIELADEVIVRFENVDILDENGNIIQYEVKELGPDNTVLNDGDSVIIDDIRYKVVYDEYGNITNAEPLDLTVKKEWAENVPLSERKSVEISVVDGNKVVTSVALSVGNNWVHTFKDLPKVRGGYRVTETKINGIKVDESFNKLYSITGNECPVTENKTVTIKNTFTTPYQCGEDKVIKLWEDSARRQKITVRGYKKVKGKWIPGEKGNTPGEETVENVEFGDCVQVKPGVPSPASLPNRKKTYFAQ